MMRLPIPIKSKDATFTEIEIKKPTSGVLADTQSTARNGDIYGAVRILLSGCIIEAKNKDRTITDSVSIRSLVSKIPYQSAEYLAEQIMLLVDPTTDAVEGIYPCPRCGHRIISEQIKRDNIEIDTRDLISNLPITYMDEDDYEIFWQLTEPVILKDLSSDQILQKIDNMTFNHPTLENCINAYAKVGATNQLKLRYATFLEALIKVNGDEVNNRWKNNLGEIVFNNIPNIMDISELSKAIRKYGRSPYISKTCQNCGKIFHPVINTSGFFGYALPT